MEPQNTRTNSSPTSIQFSSFAPNQEYPLDIGLTVSKNKPALMNSLREWLFTIQWKKDKIQYETIPFDNIRVTKAEGSETKYSFQMGSTGDIRAIASPVDDQEYLCRISQQFCIYLTKVTSQLREEWKERELIRGEVEIDRQAGPFKARENNENYREMIRATTAGMDVHLIIFDSVRDWYILSNLRHTNIVPWYGIVKINNVMHAVIQRLDDTLYSFLDENFRVQRFEDLRQKLSIITQIGYGIAFMHMKGISLMNISPWSIFIDKNANNRPVIYDMDLAVRADRPTAPWIKYFKEEAFASPEAIIQKRAMNLQNSDIYSYGILACYILTGESSHEIASKCQFSPDAELDNGIKDFIKEMLNDNEMSRPTAKECYENFENFIARL